jgi:carbamoyl-phosphate synthase large subunit
MGIDEQFGTAFAKSQLAAFGSLPIEGSAFVSLNNRDKRHMVFPVKRLAEMGFTILATAGTAQILRRHGVAATVVRKHSSGVGPDGEPTIVTRILDGEVDLVINTPSGTTPGGSPRLDGYEIRTAAVAANVASVTTVQGLAAAVEGIEALRSGAFDVRSLQAWHPDEVA